jgi:hypothetical protein
MVCAVALLLITQPDKESAGPTVEFINTVKNVDPSVPAATGSIVVEGKPGNAATVPRPNNSAAPPPPKVQQF